MRVFTRVLLVLLLATFFAVATPACVIGETAPTQSIIYSKVPVDLRFVRAGEDRDPHYQFVGLLMLCDELLDVRALTVYSPSDSTHVRATLCARTLDQFGGADSCIAETFTFDVHGGILRNQIEKPGFCTVVIFGASRAIVFELTEAGENLLLQVILKSKVHLK